MATSCRVGGKGLLVKQECVPVQAVWRLMSLPCLLFKLSKGLM